MYNIIRIASVAQISKLLANRVAKYQYIRDEDLARFTRAVTYLITHFITNDELPIELKQLKVIIDNWYEYSKPLVTEITPIEANYVKLYQSMNIVSNYYAATYDDFTSEIKALAKSRMIGAIYSSNMYANLFKSGDKYYIDTYSFFYRGGNKYARVYADKYGMDFLGECYIELFGLKIDKDITTSKEICMNILMQINLIKQEHECDQLDEIRDKINELISINKWE